MNDDLLVRDLKTTAQKVSRHLDELGIPYAFTGGLAVITYGDPRTTRDVDLILQLDPWDADKADILAAKFEEEFFFDRSLCLEGITEHTIFQALDKETSFKVDFHLSEIVPGACERRIMVTTPAGITVPMVTPEDSILSKLVWIKLGSDRSRKDVIAMLRVQQNLDLEYLEKTAEELEVAGLLKELRIQADSYDPHLVL